MLRALDALWRLAPLDDDQTWASQTLADVDTTAARDLATTWAAIESVTDPEPPQPAAPITVDWTFPVTPEIEAALEALQRQVNQATSYLKAPYFTDAHRREILAESTVARAPRTPTDHSRYIDAADMIEQYASIPGVTAANLVTVLNRIQLLLPGGRTQLNGFAAEALARLRERSGEPTIAQVVAMLDDLGFDGNALLVTSGLSGSLSGWPDDEVAAFVAAHLQPILDAAENGSPDWWHDSREEAFKLLGLVPLPAAAADTVYRLALAGPRDRRSWARQALREDPRRHQRVVAALSSSSADTRIIAAQWLAEFGTADDIEVLDARYRAERTERGRDALLTTLDAVGRAPSYYLNRETLSVQVGKAKLPPPSWPDWEFAPRVRWADGGDDVDVEVLQWLVASAVKTKSPEPSVALRYYLGLFDAADAEKFGDWLLDVWSNETYTAGDKGLLAICAAACRTHAAPVAEHYIRTYYGMRASQCKALLAMLGWVDDPAAVQLLLAISTRFRTPGIQKEAGERVAELAERNGWTPAELADRTVPDAGFADGELRLDFGPRAFHARIDPAGLVVLFDEDGKRLKSLPAPRISDDETAAAVSKKKLSAARRTVKTVVKQATERLYEAWCAERAWTVDDWNRYLRGHPVVGILAQRLVWLSDDGTSFRPLDDGTLTDVDDEEFALPAGATVRLAASSELDAAAAARWRDHFADYDAVPLFEQFPPVYAPADPRTRAIDEFVGHVMSVYTLRSAATKRGYAQGETGDGGVIFDYDRNYPILGITASINFSGAQLPLEDLTVALKEVTFHDGRGRMRLADVPSALLSATMADARAIASLGTFDEDWESKVRYR